MRRLNPLLRQSLLLRKSCPNTRYTLRPPRLQWLSTTSTRPCSCSDPQPEQPPSHSSSTSADYRALGTAQDLFTTSIYSPGSPLFLPNGTHVINKLVSFLRTQYLQYGFREVLTPTIYKRSLWEISGHWQNYKDDMYEIKSEIASALGFVEMVMTTFGLGPYRLVLSTRPEKDFIGSLELWDSAESQLREALDSSGREWAVNEGDGAFYGPKIDIQLQDQAGKYHQLSTIQLDMNLPQRFGLEYQVAEGEEDYNPATPGRATPVLVHRANFGSIERFLALLIEQYAGRWPFWLSPRQGIVLTVNQDEKVLQQAHEAAAKISGFRALEPGQNGNNAPQPLSFVDSTFLIDVDDSPQTLGKKIQRAKQMKYNFIFIVGPKDVAESRVTVDITGQLQSKPDGNAQKLQDMLVSRLGEQAVQNPRAVPLKVDEVHDILVQLEKRFV
ncbi:hypothetical protein APSETT444_008555 [Aspergillus pseudonomiae]